MQPLKRIFLFFWIVGMVGHALSQDLEQTLRQIDSLYQAYRYAQAEAILDTLAAAHPDEPRIWIKMAILQLVRFRPDEALALLEKAARREPRNAEIYFRMGNAYSMKINQGGFWNKLKSARKMREYWEKALQLDPRHVDAMVALYSYYEMAPGIAGGDSDKAAALWQRIRRLAPEYEYYLLATRYHREKDDPRAVEMLRQSIQKYPRFKPAYLTLASILIQKKQLEEAQKLLTRLLNFDPENIYALNELGEIFLEKEDYPAACYQFRKALSVNPYFVQARYQLGVCLKNKGNLDEARKEFRFILDHFPKHPLAKRVKKEW